MNIAKQLKPFTEKDIREDWRQLKILANNLKTVKPRARTGNKIVDYFTFEQRLATRGKYNINFYEFVERIDEFKKKHFIKTMIEFKKKKNKRVKKTEIVVLKEVFDICISAINIMRPLYCIELFAKYQPKTVLNCCAGWGGSLVGAAALNIDYIGIEVNIALKEPYTQLLSFLQEQDPTIQCKVFFEDATLFDYNNITYDMVFTSPPYYFIEKYENNPIYSSEQDMDERFYCPLFQKVYDGLSNNGIFAINVCEKIYLRILLPLFGQPMEIIPFNKFSRQNNYTEKVYIWKKIV